MTWAFGRIGFFRKLHELRLVWQWARKQFQHDLYAKNPELYWDTLHNTYDDLRAVGPSMKDNDKNRMEYAKSLPMFEEFTEGAFLNNFVLEVGVGQGFFTNVISHKDPSCLHGIDISQASINKTLTLFEGRKEWNGTVFNFWTSDITKNRPSKLAYNVIVMIDVSQHFPTKEKLISALHNIKSCLLPGGIVILTSYLKAYNTGTPHENFHVKYWGIQDFKQVFPEDKWKYNIYPETFNSKQLFAIVPL